jgi:hypothetical protein
MILPIPSLSALLMPEVSSVPNTASNVATTHAAMIAYSNETTPAGLVGDDPAQPDRTFMQTYEGFQHGISLKREGSVTDRSDHHCSKCHQRALYINI